MPSLQKVKTVEKREDFSESREEEREKGDLKKPMLQEDISCCQNESGNQKVLCELQGVSQERLVVGASFSVMELTGLCWALTSEGGE